MAQKPATTNKPDPQVRDYTSKILGINGGGAVDKPMDPGAKLGPTVKTLRGYYENYGLCSENALANQWYLNNKIIVDQNTRNEMNKILKNTRLSPEQKIESQYDILKEKYKNNQKEFNNIQNDRKEIDATFKKTKSAPKNKGGNGIVKKCIINKTYCVKPNARTKKIHNKAFSDDLNKKMDKLKADRDVIAAQQKVTKLFEVAKIAAKKAVASKKKAENAQAALPKGGGGKTPAAQEAAKLTRKAKEAQQAADTAQKTANNADAMLQTARRTATQATAEWVARVNGTAPTVPANTLPQVSFDQISEWEGGSHKDAYIPWPAGGGASGVTVGPGLDLGQQSPESLRKMGLSEPLVQKLSPYCVQELSPRDGVKKRQQLKKEQACNFLARNPLSLTDEELTEIDEKMSSQYASKTENLWNKNHKTPKFRDLDPKFQTVLVSRQINAATATSGDAMKAFNTAVAQGNKDAAASALNNIADSLNQDKQSGLIGRLKKEAAFLASDSKTAR